MPKKKSGGQLLPWLSARQDCKEGRFLQVGNSLLLDKQFQNLSTGARQLYICIAMEAGGKREIAFPRGSAKKYGFPETTFDRHIKELQTKGFIEKVEDGDYWQYKPNVYRFSLSWRTNSAPHFGGS